MIDEYKNNPKRLSTIQGSKRIPSLSPMSRKSSFRSRVNKHDVYRGKDCIKKFSKFLKDNQWKYLILTRKKWNY